MSPSAMVAERGQKVALTRADVIEKIQRWVALYGEPPRSADWNPSAAKWSGTPWRIPRYHAGDPETGEPWPSLNAAKRLFGGSLSAAIEAAGFEANRPGPPKRTHAEPLVATLDMPPAARVAIDAARAEAKAATARLDARGRQLAKARAATEAAREALEAARRESKRLRAGRPRTPIRTRTQTKTKTKVIRVEDEAALRRAERRRELAEGRLEAARTAEAGAKADAREARTMATKLASRLERAEATITDLRADRREARDEARAAETRATAAERLLEVERAREPRVIREVERVEVESPEAALVREAEETMTRALRIEQTAEVRVAQLERELRETVALVKGEARRLTDAEKRELAEGGPSGPAVMADALRGLATARAKGGRQTVKKALGEVASAAVRWRDRL